MRMKTHQPSSLELEAMARASAKVRGRWARAPRSPSQATPRISGTIFHSTGMPISVVRPSTPYHIGFW
jgi:hypothetical protein